MNQSNRDIVSDLKGLNKLFRLCFDRNDKAIPPYKGQDIQRKHYDGIKIKDRLKPGSDEWEGMRYQEEHGGHDLVDVILAAAYQLGFDLCCVTKVAEMQEHQDSISEVIKLLKERSIEDTKQKVEILINVSKMLHNIQYWQPDKEALDAVRDLKENTEILALLNKVL